MKRSEALDIIDEVLYEHEMPLLSGIAKEILGRLEKAGMSMVDGDDVSSWEPEEGWDEYFKEQDRKDRERDFTVTLTSAQKENKNSLYRSQVVAQEFLDGKSFEELATQYNVTRERIRQIVHKERRRFQLKEEGKLP